MRDMRMEKDIWSAAVRTKAKPPSASARLPNPSSQLPSYQEDDEECPRPKNTRRVNAG